MGFLCCICHEDLTRKEKKVDPEEGSQENGKVPERPIVTTKCGHLFHSDCLSSWFHKQGPEVWTKKECPTCRMSLTVATDLIRIFTNSADDGSPSMEDFKLHISKLERANTVLSNNLEMSFLRGRDQEKKIAQITRDLEKIQKAYIVEKTKVSQHQSEAAKLKNENEELKNVIINLNKAMTSGNNGIHLGGVVPYHHAAHNDGQVGQPMVLSMFPYHTNNGQPGGIQGLQGHGGTMQMFSNHNGHNQSSGSQQQHQQMSSWPPPPPTKANNNGQMNENNVQSEPTDPFGFMNIQHSHRNNNNKTDNLDQLNAMFQGIMGMPSNGHSMVSTTPYGDKEIRSTVEENISSSCLDSDSSQSAADSETGEKSTKNKLSSIQSKKLFSGSSSILSNGSHHDGNSSNGNSLNSSTINNIINGTNGFDQTPTDEMMDAILNSKSLPTSVNTDEFFTPKKFNPLSASAVSRAPKGKTKWKAVEYGDNANEDKKMYGKFACKNCLSKWGTSRHIFNQSQTCLRCNEVVFPYDQGPVMTKEELAIKKMARTRKET